MAVKMSSGDGPAIYHGKKKVIGTYFGVQNGDGNRNLKTIKNDSKLGRIYLVWYLHPSIQLHRLRNG